MTLLIDQVAQKAPSLRGELEGSGQKMLDFSASKAAYPYILAYSEEGDYYCEDILEASRFPLACDANLAVRIQQNSNA